MAENPLKPSSARSFLAIPLGDIFREELERFLGSLRNEAPDVRWSELGQAHLTLHFFGSIPASEIERINSSMQKIASVFSPLKLILDRIGGFPDLKKPDILWLGVQERAGRLSLLQSALQKEVQALGFEVETRPFHPHVTIGRIKGKIKIPRPLFEKIPFPTTEKTADRFVLYQSHCFPEGARHDILKTYPFSKKT